MKTLWLLAAVWLWLAPPLAAHEARLDGPLIQGGMIIGTTEPDAEVQVDGKPIRLSAKGVFLVGFGQSKRFTSVF